MSTAPTPLHQRRAPRRLRLTLPALAVLLLAAILIALLVDRIFQSSSSPAGTGSGVAATQRRSLPPFTGVDLAGENNVIVRVGASQSVIVHADSNLLTRVTTRVRSGSLVIGTTPGNLNAKTPMFVAVSVPSLDALTLNGDGNITVTGINSRRLTVVLPGSGAVHATGTTTRLEVTISGVGTALLGQLIARDVKAALSGDGSITLAATHSLKASIPGSGTIVYRC
jgi:Putative auto-transporter adhesin, head GIN domain